MRSVNMHEAKTHLSRLVEQAANGEPFIIAKAGKPMVKVVPIEEAPAHAVPRLGFLSHLDWKVPATVEEFNRDDEEIARLFNGDDE
jgi:prevent-host-death family protein